MTISEKEKWERYRDNEIKNALSVLRQLGFILDKEQVHASGERYLMSGYKLVLLGQRISDGLRVAIKLSSHHTGMREIEHDRKTRQAIQKINFSYRSFFLPPEILFTKKDGILISITQYIKQNKQFLEYSLKEQFFIALRAFETQESAHLTAHSHKKNVGTVFKIKSEKEYITEFKQFQNTVLNTQSDNKKCVSILSDAQKFISKNSKIVKLYSNFLTHTDFVPHNFCVVGRDIYLLDHTSICFGNKYESWGRFLNYMIIYNPILQEYLSKYILQNRNQEEYLSLRLMQIYKAAFLAQFYSNTLSKTTGDLHKLNKMRLNFWLDMIYLIMEDTPIEKSLLDNYWRTRDRLRGREEINRQKELGQLKQRL